MIWKESGEEKKENGRAMARTLQQARSRGARYDGRTGSGCTENTDGENTTTEASNINGTKGEETTRNTMDDGTYVQRDAENGQGDDVAKRV